MSTKTIADGKLELTVVKFEPLTGYEMLGRLQDLGSKARSNPQFMREMLKNATAIRRDVPDNERANISLGAGDASINKAFRGLGLAAMVEALAHSMDVNFADFFDAAESKRAQAAALAEAPTEP